MSRNPFAADPAVPARLARQDGDAIRSAAALRLSGGVLPGSDAARLSERFGLEPDDLALHLLPIARRLARPAISDFHVGAVGRAAGSGDLLLGANLEVRGTSLHATVHAEGFVAVRAFQGGQNLEAIAIDEAHPCAHCRQMLAEFAASSDLRLFDPLGHRLSLGDLYPWPFDPAYLGQEGARPGTPERPALRTPRDLPPEVAQRLAEAGRAAHAPYSLCPSAIVLKTPVGLFAGAALESVAFNPSLEPVQTALIDLVAQGGDPAEISQAWLAQPAGGAVDLSASTRAVLSALAPGATLSVHVWV